MSQRPPSLNIYRSLDGIGREQLESMRDWALTDGHLSGDEAKGFLWPAFKPQARLIDSDELRHLHADPDINVELDEGLLTHLDAHVRGNLPTTAREWLPTKLLPSAIHTYDPHRRGEAATRDVLKVAANETVMAERFVAKLAVCDFFNLDYKQLPEEGIWLPDSHVIGVHFVRGDSDRQKKAVRLFDDMLRTNPDRLADMPEGVIFKPVAGKPSRSRPVSAGRRLSV